jgi:thiol-disulfide isomerase/thioredoxin
MSFPANVETLLATIATRQGFAQLAVDEAVCLEQERGQNQVIVDILNGLLDSWAYSDPGKYQDAYFFLDASLLRRVVVREFLTEGTKVYTRQEWNERGLTAPSHGANYDAVPYRYPLVNLGVIGKSECPKCKTAQPVVEHYAQTYDSPEGDEWLREYLVLCLDCNLPTVLKSETSTHRF